MLHPLTSTPVVAELAPEMSVYGLPVIKAPFNWSKVKASVAVRLSGPPVAIRSFTPPPAVVAVFARSKSKLALVSVMPPVVPSESVRATPKLLFAPVVLLPGANRPPLVTVSAPVDEPVPDSVALSPPLTTTVPVPVAEPVLFVRFSLPLETVVPPL